MGSSTRSVLAFLHLAMAFATINVFTDPHCQEYAYTIDHETPANDVHERPFANFCEHDGATGPVRSVMLSAGSAVAFYEQCRANGDIHDADPGFIRIIRAREQSRCVQILDETAPLSIQVLDGLVADDRRTAVCREYAAHANHFCNGNTDMCGDGCGEAVRAMRVYEDSCATADVTRLDMTLADADIMEGGCDKHSEGGGCNRNQHSGRTGSSHRRDNREGTGRPEAHWSVQVGGYVVLSGTVSTDGNGDVAGGTIIWGDDDGDDVDSETSETTEAEDQDHADHDDDTEVAQTVRVTFTLDIDYVTPARSASLASEVATQLNVSPSHVRVTTSSDKTVTIIVEVTDVPASEVQSVQDQIGVESNLQAIVNTLGLTVDGNTATVTSVEIYQEDHEDDVLCYSEYLDSLEDQCNEEFIMLYWVFVGACGCLTLLALVQVRRRRARSNLVAGTAVDTTAQLQQAVVITPGRNVVVSPEMESNYSNGSSTPRQICVSAQMVTQNDGKPLPIAILPSPQQV